MINLNYNQQKAIEITDKPLIIIAGPGTGKTTLITKKIEYLILTKKINSNKILALTFTQKAAIEMSERVNIKNNENKFQAKTFHSFAIEIIKKYSRKIPQIDKNYILIEENHQLLFFLENLDEFNLKSIEIKNNRIQIASQLQSQIMKIKEFGFSIMDLEKVKFNELQVKLDIFAAFSKYENYKRKNNFLDFADILIYVKQMLEKHKEIREEIKKEYKYILVDEFQDTNKIQLDIINLILNDNGKNITIVGDQKQSIYSFRGANYKNLENFKTKYKNYEEIYLLENYRCSKLVLKNINKFIKIIASEKEILKLNSKEIGETKLIECSNEKSQLGFIIEKVKEILTKNPNSKIGILTRRKSELKSISEKLNDYNIEHDSSSFENLFENEIIQELIFLLKIIDNPKESNSQIFKILFDLGIRPETIRKISRKSSLKEKSLFNVLKEKKELSEFEEEDKIIYSFYDNILNLIKLKNSKVNLINLIQEVIAKFKLYQKVLVFENKIGILSLNEFINYTSNYILTYKKNNLTRFLEIIEHSKNIEIPINTDKKLFNVELMSIHNSKGKEFDFVFMPYLNDKRFPTNFKQSLFESEFDINKNDFLDEEKRLFFVGISRAKKELYLSFIKKFTQNKLDSKKSILLDLLKLESQSYLTEIISLTSDKKEEIKIEILKKMNKYLLENKFNLAKKEMELIENLFISKNSLNSFIKSNHPDFEIYKKRLDGIKNSNCTFGKNLEIDMSKQIYSVSQLKTYEQCPKKYLFTYVYKIPTIPKQYFDFGTSIHEVLENLVLEINPNINIELLYAKAINMLHKVWISKGYESAKQEREYFEKGCSAIRDFIFKEIEIQSEEGKTREIIGREKTFTINLEGRKIYGIIDRIDKVKNSAGVESLEILDYKTSNSMESTTKLKTSIQLLVYAMAVNDLYYKYPEKIGLWYLIHNKILSVKFEEKNLIKVKKEILILMKGVESEKFNPNPSMFNCKFCDFSNICDDSF